MHRIGGRKVYPTGRAVPLVLDVADDGGAHAEVPASVEFVRDVRRVLGIRPRLPVTAQPGPAVVVVFLYEFPCPGRERLKPIQRKRKLYTFCFAGTVRA